VPFSRHAAGLVIGLILWASGEACAQFGEVARSKSGCSEVRGTALDEERGFLFVACTGRIVSLDVKDGGKVLDTLDMAEGPDGIDYSPAPRKLYASTKSATIAAFVTPWGRLERITPAAKMAAYEGAFDGPRRFPLTPLADMTPEQLAVAKAIMTGPRAAVGSPAAAAGATTLSSPFNVWNRSAELANNLQKVGEYVRFRTSLPARLNELAILIVSRTWSAQYEWFAHHRLAMIAGLDPAVADDLANFRVPAGMKEDEKVIYAFTTELLERHGVSDATYKRALDAFGERGVADLIAVAGYYGLVSMTVNVDRTPIPNNGKPPLPMRP
jgi:4-carboxymuconolactone decarboxylase